MGTVYFNTIMTPSALADKAVEKWRGTFRGRRRLVRLPPRRLRPRRLADFAGRVADGDKSLKALADYVHGKGLEFGLWFEPEMVNPDSDLFRAHPDWVLKPTEGRLPMQGRTSRSWT